MNFSSYLDELRFAFVATPNWHSRTALLAATAKFHANNFFKGVRSDRSPIEIDVCIGDRARRIWVRPFAGDIFILYEVLQAETYLVPDKQIDPESVETIIDCGANIGLTALYLAGRHKNARIISVEPDPANFELLKLNTQSEPRIVPVQAAIVGGIGRPVVLSQDRPAWGNAVVNAATGARGVEVPGVTMAELCVSHGVKTIDVLKVDIEGAEEEMFSTPDFLEHTRFVMIELHGQYSLARFRADIAPMGFEAHTPATGERPRTITAFPQHR